MRFKTFVKTVIWCRAWNLIAITDRVTLIETENAYRNAENSFPGIYPERAI